MVLYLTMNQVDSCQGCVCGHLTKDIQDILWMDGCIVIMTYEYITKESLTRQILDMTSSSYR